MSENNVNRCVERNECRKKDFLRRQIVGHFICKTRIYLFSHLADAIIQSDIQMRTL